MHAEWEQPTQHVTATARHVVATARPVAAHQQHRHEGDDARVREPGDAGGDLDVVNAVLVDGRGGGEGVERGGRGGCSLHCAAAPCASTCCRCCARLDGPLAAHTNRDGRAHLHQPVEDLDERERRKHRDKPHVELLPEDRQREARLHDRTRQLLLDALQLDLPQRAEEDLRERGAFAWGSAARCFCVAGCARARRFF